MRLSDVGLALCIALGFSAVASARIINVPEDHQTIQAGIDAAEAGDTVLVQPGEYVENIDFSGKAILVGSLIVTTEDRAYLDSTVIDGNRTSCVVRFVQHEGNDSHLCGFTLQNGAHETGGGIYIGAPDLQATSPTLSDLRIVSNYARILGGGIGIEVGNPIIRDAVISRNSTDAMGGGIYAWRCGLQLENVEISDNTAAIFAGGIYGDFLRNYVLDHVTIANNRGRDQGIGAFYLSHSMPGGGEMRNCTVYGNNAGQSGTIFLDSYGYSGQWPVEMRIINSIIWGNEEPALGLQGHSDASRTRLTMSFSDLQGGQNGIALLNNWITIEYAENNLDDDPLFVDPDNGDYHLTENSPCIDAGDPEAPEDPDGTRADMGAFYFSQVHPPVLDHPIADMVVAEDCGRIEVADLDTVFSDAEVDSIWYVVFGPEALNLALNEENLLWFEPALNFNGDSLIVQVRAYAGSDSTSEEFFVTVTPVNDPPRQFNLISPDLREPDWFYRDDTIHFEWSASVDPDSESVNYILQIDFTGDLWSYDAGTQTSRDLPDSNDVLPWSWFGDRVSVIGLATWWVVAISGSDTVRSDSTRSFGIGVGVENEQNSAPASFSINSVFPNPFNSSTTIRFGLSKLAPTRIGIYGLDGRLVQELGTGRDAYPPGEHSVIWNANGLPAGVYLLALESGTEMKMTKIVLLK